MSEKPYQPERRENLDRSPTRDVRYDNESVRGLIVALEKDFNELRRKGAALEGKEATEINADAVMLGRDIENAKDQINKMESHATFDVLTELLNRRGFEDKLHYEVGLIDRLEHDHIHENMHILFIDIDNFKSINDTLGHDVGDLYLKTVATSMKQKLNRGTDVLARLGGDEFAAILLGNENNDAEQIAEQIREAVNQASIAAKKEAGYMKGAALADNEANVSASIGLVALQKGERPEDILKRADEAMYEAKRAGKNGVVAKF
jgi:diguanylate cyclase (GGDEF)-like protein